MTAPCAIEYILVTRWRGGKKGGQNRVCACDTRDRGVNKKLKPEHPSETVVMPESGERMRNLTTLVLVKNAAVKRSRSRQKVSESSQNPLSSSRRRERARQGRSNVQRSSNDERWAALDVSPSSHLAFHIPNTCYVLFGLCCVLGLGCFLLCGVFVSCFASVLESRILRTLDLDDQQGFIASSAMQQKKIGRLQKGKDLKGA